MEDHNLIDQLIDTYHSLNTHVRTAADARLQLQPATGPSVEAIVRSMRDHELHFSQSLKERISGVPVQSAVSGEEAPVIGTEADEDSTAVMIAQFGSAREVTLALLRGLPDAAWDQAGEGGASIRATVSELVASDQRQLAAISAQLDGGAPQAPRRRELQ